jgi:hypothetical protein
MPPSNCLKWLGEGNFHHPFRAIFNRVRRKQISVGTETLPLQLFHPMVQLHLCRKTMKKLQQLFAAVVLTLVLSASTFAGEGVIWPWVIAPPPPPSSSVVLKDAADAEGVTTIEATSADSVTEVALSLLPSLLALF